MTADGAFPTGGWQGGRTMENCAPDNLDPSEPMCSGAWYVRNVREELDFASEYFFDAAAQTLTLFYNATSGTAPPADFELVASQLEVFFNLTGASPADPVADVSFAGLGLRDQRHAQLERWTDPSGGDWALRRAGLFHLESTARVTIQGNTFFRTDANAVMVAAYNRNATVADNEFAFIGMTAVATFGSTVQDDGTGATQPFGTVIAYNVAREIGQYQLQSSLWFSSRSTLTRAEGNVVFNVPRAAININDAFGGGNNMTALSLFNTCRQSGDHGPINSWSRMPFLTDIATGGVGQATYAPALTETSHSMIYANYGASQGFDNDDGSSYYDTHDNFFYDASGFKMVRCGYSVTRAKQAQILLQPDAPCGGSSVAASCSHCCRRRGGGSGKLSPVRFPVLSIWLEGALVLPSLFSYRYSRTVSHRRNPPLSTTAHVSDKHLRPTGLRRPRQPVPPQRHRRGARPELRRHGVLCRGPRDERL